MSQTAHRPVLIVIAGPNGSGKTTITSKILKHEWLENALYINPDQVAQDRFGDWNSPEAVLQAAQYCERQREECLRNQQSLIFETVLSSDGKVDFIRSINSSRIARRVMKGGHDVPIPKIISRYQKSILNCKRVAAIADRVYVYDNSVDDAEARLLFRMTDGKPFKRYTDDIPLWAQNIIG